MILELLSGFVFLSLAISVKVDIFSIKSIINFIFLLIYVSILFIIAGIDKEKIIIEKSVLIVGFIIELLYIIYQYILSSFNVYQYVMYLIVFGLAFLILKFTKNKKYIIQNLFLYLYIVIFNGVKVSFFTFIIFLGMILIYKLIHKKNKEEITLGFYLCISNILTLIILNIITNYII